MKHLFSIAVLLLAAIAAAGEDFSHKEHKEHKDFVNSVPFVADNFTLPPGARIEGRTLIEDLSHKEHKDFVNSVPFVADNFTLPPGARIEGTTLIAEIVPGSATNAVHCEAPLDLSGLLSDETGLVLAIRLRADGVTKPAHDWNGVKFMLRYEDADTGKTHFPGASVPVGTYGWRTVTNRVNILTTPVNPVDGRATLVLGLQESTGRVEFDLSSLALATEDVGVSPVNRDYIVRYPENDVGHKEHIESSFVPSVSFVAENNQPLRGCMLPHRDPVTEDDIETLHRWGATLVRFQISRNWSAVDDNQDLDEYAAWVDSRLDNLVEVMGWCAARGMKVCVDLHTPPGGKRAGDRAMNMFYDARFADAFVETWRRIARRCVAAQAALQSACAPALQSAGILYGYDLINEPIQRVPAPFPYWELQRRAAEAIRAIDPDTAIVVESNLGCVAESYRYLSPLAMDNVIYQVHLYKPYEYTHQGVWDNPRELGGRPLVWPDPSRGWTTDHLRRVLAPVRDFQERHHARIYVGEFSAVSWAPGAENYLRDCIALFDEYGWDWTYHAFREWGAWSVEHEAIEPGRAGPSNFRPVEDSPRKRALLEGLGK